MISRTKPLIWILHSSIVADPLVVVAILDWSGGPETHRIKEEVIRTITYEVAEIGAASL